MSTFFRLIAFLRPFRANVIATLLFAIAAMAMTVAVPWLLGEGVDAIQSGNGDRLKLMAILILAAAVCRFGLTFARRTTAGKVSLGVEMNLRNHVYRHLHRLELAFFDQQGIGQLMTRATTDLQAVRFFLGYGLVFIIQEFFTIIFAAAIMFVLNPELALLALFPVPFIVLMAQIYGKKARPALQAAQQQSGELTTFAEENITGIRVVKAFAQEQRQNAAFGGEVDKLFGLTMRSTRLRAFYSPILELLPNIGLAVLLIYGGQQAINGSIGLGEFVQFYSYLLMLVFPMRRLGMALGMAQRAVASGNRVFDILDREPRIVSTPGAAKLQPGNGKVVYKRASFAYNRGNPVLSDIDIEIPAGTSVALVGPTGAGKTTLAMLIPRLYDVDSGSLSVDGQNVKDIEVGSLRDEIALVSADSFLFSDSVRENIAYAKPTATAAEIEAAARKAKAHDFIEALPDGYNTVIGERGITLSGGQRQRVALARALLANPRILILDDATSSVDAATETEIKAALKQVMKGRTTIIIAHRLSTIELADHVVVLDRGRVTAQGSRDQLMHIESHYRTLEELDRLERLHSREHMTASGL